MLYLLESVECNRLDHRPSNDDRPCVRRCSRWNPRSPSTTAPLLRPKQSRSESPIQIVLQAIELWIEFLLNNYINNNWILCVTLRKNEHSPLRNSFWPKRWTPLTTGSQMMQYWRDVSVVIDTSPITFSYTSGMCVGADAIVTNLFYLFVFCWNKK